ncbi:formyltransferase family protein [Listeria booriae]|uniref:Formyl transferase N-terminal domain-containing protein n=1 Tax=Listeria booriae TaxID=1552123 RepID=A0A7X0YPR6_9LIST|nr:formyltransferase family protein [Listeria booriae]MBC2118320.1 hypothetical protein [Listeria booriae]
MKIMLFCKKTSFCDYAVKILQSYFSEEEIKVVRGDGSTKLDEELSWYQPEYIISFLSPWIIPQCLLDIAQKDAINFHPGSPDYPGSGCYNFAIYEGSQQYGVVCHHMEKSVDTGKMVSTSYFDISPYETVETLKLKSMNHLLYIFEKVINEIYVNDTLPKSKEKWTRVPFTKKQLDELCEIDPITMDQKEIDLRIRATDYNSAYKSAYFKIDEKKHYIASSMKEPIV